MFEITKSFEWCSDYNINDIVIRIDDINKPKSIVIVDSFDVTEPEHMYEVVDWIYNFEFVKTFDLDSKWLQISKWKTNNLLYELGYNVNRTKNVYIEEDTKWYHNLGYFLFSLIY